MKRTGAHCCKMASTHKKMESARKSITKEVSHKASIGKLITENDFDEFREEAASSLNGIVKSVEAHFSSRSTVDRSSKRRAFNAFIESNGAMIRKWCINVLALLILYGNGQRNQVYRMLKSPTITELDAFEENEGGSSASVPFNMDLVGDEGEKVPRDVKIPFIMFDPVVFPFIYFHVDYVRPYLVQVAEGKGNFVSNALLLDTRNGMPLSSDNVRFTFVSFVKHINPELHLTPMDVRACYATYMTRRYVERNMEGNEERCSFSSMNESTFFEMLSSVMNTSSDMLRNVYTAASHTSYAEQVADVLDIVSRKKTGI